MLPRPPRNHYLPDQLRAIAGTEHARLTSQHLFLEAAATELDYWRERAEKAAKHCEHAWVKDNPPAGPSFTYCKLCGTVESTNSDLYDDEQLKQRTVERYLANSTLTEAQLSETRRESMRRSE